jgi:hypothetical protein
MRPVRRKLTIIPDLRPSQQPPGHSTHGTGSATPGNLKINHNPRNGLPYFNTSLFTPKTLGTQGNAKRRFFYGPGINNFDIALHKMTKLTVTKSFEFRLETFNTFNRAQFYPNGSADGNINDATFGHVLKAAPPGIGQVALRFNF